MDRREAARTGDEKALAMWDTVRQPRGAEAMKRAARARGAGSAIRSDNVTAHGENGEVMAEAQQPAATSGAGV